MTREPINEPQQGEAAAVDTDVASWMVFQLAVHVRRVRTRRELFRVSERDLDRMGLTRFDVGN